MQFDLVVIGGGAAGFFGAIQTKEMKPNSRIIILEKTSKLLSKVRVSGGGRCNVTHHCYDPYALAKRYPRGEKLLKTVFKTFQAEQMVKWLASKDVFLHAESDGRMFPDTNSSETIVNCFIDQAEKSKIKILPSKKVVNIERELDAFKVICSDETAFQTQKILIATGGNTSRQAYEFISNLGHGLKDPIPSLFTFNDSEKRFRDLMGVAVPLVEVKIEGTKFFQSGPVLITHWGLSGPAVIKLSAWAAEYLHQVQYKFIVLVNWTGKIKEEQLRTLLSEHKKIKGKQKVLTHPMFSIPMRLWQRLCTLAEVEETKTWSELSQKTVNKFIEFLIRCPFQIQGKTTFKEEFVTCGGVNLNEINPATMESKLVKDIFFAGEVLDIDGETGGFNFQSAWSTAFIAAKAIAGG